MELVQLGLMHSLNGMAYIGQFYNNFTSITPILPAHYKINTKIKKKFENKIKIRLCCVVVCVCVLHIFGFGPAFYTLTRVQTTCSSPYAIIIAAQPNYGLY